MKDFLATILKVFDRDHSLDDARRELTQAGRDLPKLYGRNWSDRAHF